MSQNQKKRHVNYAGIANRVMSVAVDVVSVVVHSSGDYHDGRNP